MNALDYLDWRGDLPFACSPVNGADLVLFTLLGKADLSGTGADGDTPVPLPEAFGSYFRMNAENNAAAFVASHHTVPMFDKVRSCERYREVSLAMFVNKIVPEKTEQFSALTIRLNGVSFVTFRGTDDTLVGWKEDFRLAAMTGIPAQLDAEKYLLSVAKTFDGPIVVTGHSKGGNLAVWASVKAPESVQDRILNVVSYDGPGFPKSVLSSPEYLRIAHKIVSVVPEHSVVGMILNHAGTQQIVRSQTSGISGHDPLTWEMNRSGLIPAPSLSDTSTSFHNTQDDVFSKMDQRQLDELVEGIFGVIDASGAVRISDFSNGTLKKMIATARGLGSEPEVYVFMKALLGGTIRRKGIQLFDRFFPGDPEAGKETV